ncbi:hypothetical protein R1flu_017272 [Riccia fluitans]|uniref:Uncharacterized protein n=1 Tax=Riccia fluitans TaxID=41844 RepID=A0ABD1XDX8_9MARC
MASGLNAKQEQFHQVDKEILHRIQRQLSSGSSLQSVRSRHTVHLQSQSWVVVLRGHGLLTARLVIPKESICIDRLRELQGQRNRTAVHDLFVSGEAGGLNVGHHLESAYEEA